MPRIRNEYVTALETARLTPNGSRSDDPRSAAVAQAAAARACAGVPAVARAHAGEAASSARARETSGARPRSERPIPLIRALTPTAGAARAAADGAAAPGT